MKPYYADDSVTIYHGDCGEVIPTLGTVDLIVTDPPYGMAFRSNFRVATPKFAAIRGDRQADPAALLMALERLREGGAAYVATRWDVYPKWYEAINVSCTVKNCIVWHKPGGGMGDLQGDYMPEHEFLIYAIRGRHTLRGGRVSNVWRVAKDPPASYEHPTQKPTALLARAILKSSDPGQIVLDPYMGSGSTLRAAKDNGRRAIGIEIEERYCEVAAKRCAQEVLDFG